jgi:hypothetical protein
MGFSADWRRASSPFGRCVPLSLTLALPKGRNGACVTISIPNNGDLLQSVPASDDEGHDWSHAPQGESLSIIERLVVSPAWGRLRPGAHEEGQALDVGAVIGVVREAGEEFPLVCSAPSVFVGWLAVENERVPPGRAVARVRSLEA